MVDIERQIVHWRDGAAEDWQVANELVRKGRVRHGLFFAHLALEKVLKACVCRHTRDLAPKIHNLNHLAELAGLALEQEQVDILAEINPFNELGLYPDPLFPTPTAAEGRRLIQRVSEVYQWATAR